MLNDPGEMSVKQPRPHIGKHFLVTGGGSGIGAAVCESLLACGAHIHAITGREPYTAEENRFFDEENVDTFNCDFSNFDALEIYFTNLKNSGFQLDAAILCHGYGAFGSLEQFSQKDLIQLINVNLTSNVLIARQILPMLKRRQAGDLVLIGSEAGLKGGKKGAAYCAAKFGLNGFVQALREECAASNVRVSVINPGMVKTPFFDDLDFEPGDHRNNYLQAEDVASAVELILSMPAGSVIDEINLSPQKNVIRHKKQ